MALKRKHEDIPSYWKRFVVGPESVDRPQKGHLKGYFYFFAKDNDENIESIWDRIALLTSRGYLGHFSSFSDDNVVVAVHAAHPRDVQDMKRIEINLNTIGVKCFRFREKYEENDPKKYKFEEVLDINQNDFEFWNAIRSTGRVFTKEEYLQNRNQFEGIH